MGRFHDLMDRELVIRGYAERTRETYLYRMRNLVVHHRRSPDQLTLEEINSYQHHLAGEKGASKCVCNQTAAAIRFFYRHVVKRDWDITRIPYQRKASRRLPVILSIQEVVTLVQAPSSLKHRAMLMVAYGAGLRLEEIRNLKISDILSDRMQIRVEKGKGQVDRYVMLSKRLLVELRAYYCAHRPRQWMFENDKTHKRLHPTSFQAVFTKAKYVVGIKKKVSLHSLRHAFATHLLEAGTNVLIIQSLMGHRSLSTTQVYLSVAREIIDATESPLDQLPDLIASPVAVELRS